MSIADIFGFDMDMLSALGDDSLFEGSSTTVLRAGKRIPYRVSINGTNVQSYVTLHEASLTRLSLLKQQSVNLGRDYWLVTGIMKPVKMDIEMVIDGETINLVDFLHSVANRATNKDLSRDEWLLLARRIGLNFEDGMPVFFQQFGASFDGFKNAIEAFKTAGAEDVLKKIAPEKRGRIQAAYAHETGVPVTSFELGSVDRSKSPRGQGFIDLGDAVIGNFTRIVRLRKEARVLQEQISAAKDWSQDKIKTAQAKVDELNKMSRQWPSSWTGAQQRILNENGNYRPDAQFDPVNAPCGRFTMVVNNAEVAVDLWSNSARANSGSTSAISEVKF